MEGFKFTYNIEQRTVVYDNVYMLVLDLFDREYVDKKEIDHFELLRSYLDHYHVEKEEVELIRDIINGHVEQWKQWDDVEHCTLVLMQKLKKHEVLMLVDLAPIVDMSMPITVNKDTVVQFIDITKIEVIRFN